MCRGTEDKLCLYSIILFTSIYTKKVCKKMTPLFNMFVFLISIGLISNLYPTCYNILSLLRYNIH